MSASILGRRLALRGRGHQYDPRERMSGFFLGKVEYTIDPLRQGRVKVRIPQVHSTEKSIETADLPWARPLGFGSPVHDCGFFSVPPVGAVVWVAFWMDDPGQPLYLGGVYKNPTEEPEVNTKTSRETGNVLPERPVSGGQILGPVGPEPPLEVLSTPYEPTVHIQKSLKGATVLIQDRDGFEQVRVVDRTGQELSLSGPVNVGANLGNEARRGVASAREALPSLGGYEFWDDNHNGASRRSPRAYPNVVGRSASAELVGLTGQGLRVLSKEAGEEVLLESRGVDPYPRTHLRLGSGARRTELVGVDDEGDCFRVAADSLLGQLLLAARSRVTVEAPELTLDVERVRIRGDLVVEGRMLAEGETVASRAAMVVSTSTTSSLVAGAVGPTGPAGPAGNSVTVTVSASEPSSPTNGDFWIVP